MSTSYLLLAENWIRKANNPKTKPNERKQYLKWAYDNYAMHYRQIGDENNAALYDRLYQELE